MSFGTDNAVNYDGNSVPKLGPGIYKNAELESVKIEAPEKEDGTKLQKRIVFLFKTETGEYHTHIEYNPKDDDEKKDSKTTSLVKRIGHILSKFVSKERLIQNNQDFDSYANWVVSTLAQSHKGKKVDFAVVGNVYNNKASAELPLYPPFIVLAGQPLGFDKNAIEANKKYENFMNVGGATPNGGVPAAGEEPQF